ncbi:conserved hypothetical protein [Frankia sp. Hr75.2]|nr:hypothetical protein E0504_23270 [Parafrankia sp. BMG5.11]CAI7980330.1 conserved hypothetical protein [Frankia sp. Hr75.2]SQD97545.1 conserved hypothetical protein [Parafrankia sp. Ea1.12]
MPKNYGAGVTGGAAACGAARVGGPLSFVRLGRRELWMRLDRNMVAGARRGSTSHPPAASPGAARVASGS